MQRLVEFVKIDLSERDLNLEDKKCPGQSEKSGDGELSGIYRIRTRLENGNSVYNSCTTIFLTSNVGLTRRARN